MFLGEFIGLAGLHHAPVVPLVFLGQVLREKIEIRLAQNVLQLAVVMLAVLLVGKREPALEVLAKNVLRHRFHERMVKRFRAAQRLLRLPPLRDVLDRAFVIKQFALRVAHGAAVLRNPDDGPVLAVNLRLEPAQRVVLLHQAHKLVAPARFDIELPRDVLDARHHFRRRVVAVNARQRHVGQQNNARRPSCGKRLPRDDRRCRSNCPFPRSARRARAGVPSRSGWRVHNAARFKPGLRQNNPARRPAPLRRRNRPSSAGPRTTIGTRGAWTASRVICDRASLFCGGNVRAIPASKPFWPAVRRAALTVGAMAGSLAAPPFAQQISHARAQNARPSRSVKFSVIHVP